MEEPTTELDKNTSSAVASVDIAGWGVASNVQTIGTHQEIHVGTFKTDRKGMLSGSIQRHRDEAKNDINASLLILSAAPQGIIELACVGAERTWDPQSKRGIYTYSYEGLVADPDDSQTTFELDITMEEVGIEAHPNLLAIEAKYGSFDPRLKRFPKYAPTATSGSGLSNPQQKKQQLNKLYGTDSWEVFGATFKKSYVRKAIPPAALRGIGTIIKRPPGLARFPLPPAAKYRQWLKLAPKITRRGNCVNVEENFVMSGRHGIVPEIYGAAQLEEDPPDDE